MNKTKKYIAGILIIIASLVILSILLCRSSDNRIRIHGTIELPMSSWSPYFEGDGIQPAPIIKHKGEIYYLDGLRPFLDSLPFEFWGREAIITGTVEERELDVPLRKAPNPPTKKQTFRVLNIEDIKLVE